MTGINNALASLNTPFLTTTAGVTAATVLPNLSQVIADGALPWKLVNLCLFGASLYAAQAPGRLDGVNPADFEDEEISNLVAKRDTTLLMPKGWAFTIWPAIFLGELLSTVGAFLLEEGGSTESVLQAGAAGFAIAQVFQMLWVASFRPKYIRNGASWVSAGMLTGIASSLAKSHKALLAGDVESKRNYILYVLPVSLHFGWTSAAALVNWNGNIAMLFESEKVVAGAAWTSAIAATALGVAVTVTRQAPIFGGVIAWALAACAGGMHDRTKQMDAKIEKHANKWFGANTEEEIRNRKGFYGANEQKWLCGIGAAVSGGVAILTAFQGGGGGEEKAKRE